MLVYLLLNVNLLVLNDGVRGVVLNSGYTCLLNVFYVVDCAKSTFIRLLSFDLI